ncbi:MAG: Maf family protein [Rhodospirillales bacterium]
MPPSLVLASASSARALVLERAGLTFKRDPADIDESIIKQHYQDQEKDAPNLALNHAEAAAQALANAKALAISPRHPTAQVIGADQMLVCNGRWFDKPANLSEAREHLKALRGQTHELISAICIAVNDKIVWQHVESTQLTMLSFSDAFLETYLERSGSEVLESVGVYRLEGLGPQLFSEIDGNYFAILGLPLLPLLSYLRDIGVIDQ